MFFVAALLLPFILCFFQMIMLTNGLNYSNRRKRFIEQNQFNSKSYFCMCINTFISNLMVNPVKHVNMYSYEDSFKS